MAANLAGNPVRDLAGFDHRLRRLREKAHTQSHANTDFDEEQMTGATGDSRKRKQQQAGAAQGQGGAKRPHNNGSQAVIDDPGECVVTHFCLHRRGMRVACLMRGRP